jgi:hypothetical protein
VPNAGSAPDIKNVSCTHYGSVTRLTQQHELIREVAEYAEFFRICVGTTESQAPAPQALVSDEG